MCGQYFHISKIQSGTTLNSKTNCNRNVSTITRPMYCTILNKVNIGQNNSPHQTGFILRWNVTDVVLNEICTV